MMIWFSRVAVGVGGEPGIWTLPRVTLILTSNAFFASSNPKLRRIGMNEMRRRSGEIVTLKVTGATCGAFVKAVEATIASSPCVWHPAQAAQRSARKMDRTIFDTVSPNVVTRRRTRLPASSPTVLDRLQFACEPSQRSRAVACVRSGESLERKRQARIEDSSPRISVHRVVADLTRERLIGKRRCPVHQILDAE